MEHTPKVVFLGCIFFLLATFNPCAFAQVQDKLREKVEKENPAKTKETPKNEPPKDNGAKAKSDTTKPNNPNANPNGNGQAPFSANGVEIDPASIGRANTMFGAVGEIGNSAADKEKDPKIDDNARQLDTARFKNRALVKKREAEQYKNGLGGGALSHRNTDTYKYKLAKGKYVLGWHPYWVGEAYKSYNFSLLNVLVYYSYEVEPSTGNYRDIHDWYDTDLVRYAHKQNPDCKVLLSVSNFGKKENETFLQNVDAQSNLIRKVIKALKDKKGDGIHLDFEGVPTSQREAFTNFVIDLAAKVRTEIKGAFISITLPSVDFEQAFDVRQLNNHANLLVINGTEFYGANSEFAGPISQIGGGKNWWSVNLESSLEEYLAAGADPHKVLMGISYYGAEWVTENLKTPSKARKFVRYLSYREAKQKIGFAVPSIDEESRSSYYVYRDNNNNYRQIWYEDSLSLAKKCDWVLEKKLAGVGIWALGYDNGYPQLWQALGAKFGGGVVKPSRRSNAGVSYISRFIAPIVRLITQPRLALQGPGTFITSFLMLFGAAGGIFYVLYRYSCYFTQMRLLLLRGGFTALILMLVYVIAAGYNLVGDGILLWLLLGIFIGALIFFILVRNFITEKQLP